MSTRTFTFSVTAPNTNQPTWLQGRAIGEWFQIPNTRPQLADAGVSIPALVMQINGPKSKISAWCGGALRRSDSRYFMHGGGHGDYAGNEVQSLSLASNTPTWTTHRTFSDPSVLLNNAPVYKDWRRAATHTYYGIHFINQDNRLAILPAPGMGTGGLTSDPAWEAIYIADQMMCSFDMATNDWDWQIIRDSGTPGRGYYANQTVSPGGDFTAAMACMDHSTGDLYYARESTGGKLLKWTRATNSWAIISNSYFHRNYSGTAYDHTRQRILRVGGFGLEVPGLVINATNGATTALPTATDTATRMRGYPGVVYDEVRDSFFVLGGSSDDGLTTRTLVEVDAATLAVKSFPTTGNSGNFTHPGGALTRFQYVPALKGLVFANDYAQDLYFVRTA